MQAVLSNGLLVYQAYEVEVTLGPKLQTHACRDFLVVVGREHHKF